ncbi:hypothetical protein AX17_007198 [Amanita inopinata Kibby_2008]|nr:hypothetical protein AX17_007198 [Amanita inopinata Kibby_2008]
MVSDNVEAGPLQKRPKALVLQEEGAGVGEGPKKAAEKKKAEKGPAEPTIEVREPLGHHTVIVDNGVFERLIRDVRNLSKEVELLWESNQVLGESIDRLTGVMKQMVSVAEGEPEYLSEEDELQGVKERKAVEDKGVEQVAEVKRGPNDPLLEEVEKSESENAEQEEESEGSEDS